MCVLKPYKCLHHAGAEQFNSRISGKHVAMQDKNMIIYLYPKEDY